MEHCYRIIAINADSEYTLDVGISQFDTLLEVIEHEARQLQGEHNGPAERTKALNITLEYIPISDSEVDISERS